MIPRLYRDTLTVTLTICVWYIMSFINRMKWSGTVTWLTTLFFWSPAHCIRDQYPSWWDDQELFLSQICSFDNDVSDLITITRLTFSLAGGQVPSSWQLWADGGNPHCQVIVLIFLFFSIHISLPCANDKLYYNFTVLCFCRHHNIQLITFTFCCNLYKTLHKHVIFIRLSLNTFPTGYAFLCPAS